MSTALRIPPTTLGKRIQEAREWRRIGQAELALQMRVSRPTISNWERGMTSPNYAQVVMLAEKLDVDAEWLETGSVTDRYPKPVVRLGGRKLVAA